MDAIAFFPTAAAPTDAPPLPDAASGDAFASVFASAMIGEVGDEKTAFGDGSGELAPTETVPTPPEVSLPPMKAERPEIVTIPTEPLETWPVEKTIGPVPIVPPEESPRPATASPPAEKGPAALRARARIETPPEPPPLPPASTVPEKEAPTTAPNAPVPPLDRTSDPKRAEEKVLPDKAPAAAPTALQVVIDAPRVVLANEAPREPAKAASGSQATTLRVASAKVDPPERAKASIERNDGTSTEDSAPPALLTDPPLMAAASEAPPEPAESAPALPDAPDLGIASQATFHAHHENPRPTGSIPEGKARMGDPSTGPTGTNPLIAPNPLTGKVDAAVPPVLVEKPAPKGNAAQAPVVLERSAPKGNAVEASVPMERPSPKVAASKALDAAATVEIETAVLQGDLPKGDDAPEDDSPKTPLPPPEAPSLARTSATERPDEGVQRPSVDRHLVVRQVADRIESLVAARPKDGVTVHLEPRDLGTLTLVVKGLSHALDVQVTASDDRVRQSLDASRPELVQALLPRGIELREMRIAVAPPTGSAATGANAGMGGRANPEGQARPQTPSPPSFVRTSRAEVRAPRASRSSGRGVDLLV